MFNIFDDFEKNSIMYQGQDEDAMFEMLCQTEISRLKIWENFYQRAIEEKIFPPLSDLQAFTVNELQKVSYRLDVLCVSGTRREKEQILMENYWCGGGGGDT